MDILTSPGTRETVNGNDSYGICKNGILDFPEYSSEPKYIFDPHAGGRAVDPIPKARFQ